ncbi:hypothetical protein IQ265_23955 [Nodosilinea sp. LEGE 06152]|uniref:hypothetical protein n=1 Tax=Nodosilinea sp. LEGE 06152 TaxID=2777966 RepID=UPI00187E98C7|nr:hypothetical protein [Nodosilinea sp. LEGE 06152]MBE9159864.1 hypothetical protein [Nodosilinea sp. LEGE 06152]
MDDFIAEIKKAYLEEITILLAPKMVVFTIFFMLCIVSWSASEGLWGNLLAYKIVSFFDFSTGPISQVLVRDFLVGVIAAYLTHYSYQMVKDKWFNFVGHRINLEARINARIQESSHLRSENEAINLFIVKGVQKDIEDGEKKLYRYHSVGAFSMSILIASISAFIFSFSLGYSNGAWVFHRLDLLASFASLVIILFVQERATIYFLKRMMPLIVVESTLAGKGYNLIQ